MKWLFGAWLAVQAHFAASYLVPLDERAQREFGGLLRWFWPWAAGDAGPLGQMSMTGFPVPGFFIAVTAAGLLALAAFAAVGWWIPTSWWRPLAAIGAALSVVVLALFPGATKLLPIASGIAIAAVALADAAPRAIHA